MEEDIVQYVKEKREIWQVAFAEFIQEYQKDGNFVYFFCEGKEDKKYYISAIEKKSVDKDRIKPYFCNGKDNVIEIEKKISSKLEYSSSKLLFFVDRDFDDNISLSPNIYVTNYYSIENYYTSEYTFKEILKNEYNIKDNSEDFNEAKKIFNTTKERFHEKIILLNAFLACQADYRNINNENTRLKIDKSLNKYFSGNYLDDIVDKDFNINICEELNVIEKIKEIFSEAPEIEDEKIVEKKNKFDVENKSEIFRGKFEIKFFISFLKRFKDKITSENSIFTEKYKCSIDIKENDFATILLGYVYIPNCLKDYIKAKI